MQEGTVAFVQMARITAAVTRHRAAGLPYLVYLRHPTTGGVLASWGSLGHVTAAEPGALIGFLGPRVYEALHGEPFPPGVQVAENLYARGLVDAVVAAGEIAEMAARALSVLCPASALDVRTEPPPSFGRAPLSEVRAAPPASGAEVARSRAAGQGAPGEASQPGARDVSPHGAEAVWEGIERSRREGRPGIRELLRFGAGDVTLLSGTGAGEADAGLQLALARFGGQRCVVVGQDRRAQRSGHPLGPAGLRVARRGMRLAEELRLPLVTVVDTPGAVLSAEAEEGGLAGEIARCLADLMTLAAPTVCLLLGEGTGGAALALLPADRVLCAGHGWLSPLPPEGASVIVHRDTAHAPAMAEAQGVAATELLRNGIVDRIIPECPDAADEAEPFCIRVAAVLEEELDGLHEPTGARLARYDRIVTL
jgi:acetyl-CoA carboxylase carboxyl transferase subunit beta